MVQEKFSGAPPQTLSYFAPPVKNPGGAIGVILRPVIFPNEPFELAFTRCRNNLKMIRNLTVKNSLQDFGAKEMYLHSKHRSVAFKIIELCSFFIIFECSHNAFSKMYRLLFRFQNLPFSKSAGKNVPFSCEQEAYPSHFLPFSKCAGIV